jgi:hypothetical protein
MRPNVNFTVVISGFRRDVDDICALLGYYAEVLTFEDGTDWLSRNFGTELRLNAA